MNTSLNAVFASARGREMLDAAELRRSRPRRGRERAPWDSSRLWQALTVRLATGADRAAIARLAELEQAAPPAEPVLLGVVMERPVAALSLSDGRVLADPFTPSADLVELMRLRARQLDAAAA
jgi:hypothetical protein